MTPRRLQWFAFSVLALLAVRSAAAGEQKLEFESPYVFTDENAVLAVNADAGEVGYSIKTITYDGYGPTARGTAKAADGRLSIKPLCEGIHVVSLDIEKPVEVRFLAIGPPAKASAAAARKALPRTSRKLLSGRPYTILAMGDSVAHTGDFEGLLVMILKRATGNENILSVERTYSGRSVDAAVRFWKNDGPPNHPDLGLLMYGLNDQGAFASLPGYLEQYRFIADRLAADCNADAVLMMPTPHIQIPVREEDRTPRSEPEWFAFRTIGFAESLRPLAAQLHVPLAETFAAVWGRGGPTVQESVKNAWPMFPTHYGRQMTSMLETGGKGDTIHPNVLGHLAIARAVSDAIFGLQVAPPLAFSGYSAWADGGVVSHVVATNRSGAVREGTLRAYPLIDARIDTDGPVAYRLAPGEAVEFEVRWPQAKKPEDLFEHPNNIYLAPGSPLVPVVDFCAGGSRVYAARAPFEFEWNYVRGRQVVDEVARVALSGNAKTVITEEIIPPNSNVGRIWLLSKLLRNNETWHATAELAYVRFGAALQGEAAADGDLAEWQEHRWFSVGETVQARWTKGPEDNRAELGECFTRWALKAGENGIYFAVRGTGELLKDKFTLFFDTRDAALLGTAGRYYWCSGSLKDGGRMQMRRGETSRESPGLEGAWKKTPDGIDIELFVPYELMELHAWPDAAFRSPDLGLSIWWSHVGPDGKTTHLMWSEDGHPWNTRWYGVVRLVKRPDENVPYMVRIK